MSKKETQWFSHDAGARHDHKLAALIADYKMAGYGRWWVLVEILRGQGEYKYNIAESFAYRMLAKEFLWKTDQVKQFITQCIDEYKLLQTDGTYIWSEDLSGRMEYWDNKRALLIERGRKGAATTNAKRSAQAKTSDGTSAAHNITEHNTTENNNHLKGLTEVGSNDDVENRDTAVSPLDWQKNQSSTQSGGGGGWNALKDKALSDPNFLYPIISTGRVTETQLAQWLTAFNKLLAFRGEEPKNDKDYRHHFVHWFKFRNPQKEDPETFVPIPEQRNKAPVIINAGNFMKTPQQIEEEQKQQRERWKKI